MNTTLRQRFFAWMLKKGDAFSHQLYGSYKKDLLGGVRGTVVEIGPGTGVNFHYLPGGIEWIGIEPNLAFHELLREKATRRRINASLMVGDALKIPVPDNRVDALISTLVLCSVKQPTRVLSEIKRVLRPGGQLIFIEHVAAPRRSALRLTQNICNPLNRIVADGCNCNRETWLLLEQAGFAQLQLTHHRMKGTFKLHSPHILGLAIK